MARRQANIFINGQQAKNTIKELTDEKRKLVRELNMMVIGSEQYNDQIERIRQIDGNLSQHRGNLRQVEKGWKDIAMGATQFLGVAGIAFSADAIIGYAKELFTVGVQMDTLGRKAQTVLGESLGFVTAQAEENARAMGLTNSQYVAAATNIADLLIPMGFQRQEAAETSSELVNLAGALSEWTGGQFTAQEVTQSLGKALLGEREELERYGIAIKQSEVNAELAARGLDKLTGAAQRQAEAMITMELITNKSLDAQRNYAENSDSLIRNQAELQAKIKEISETLAVTLIPVFTRLVDLAGDVVDVASDISKGLNSLVDPSKALTRAYDEQANRVNALEKELNPLLERYDDLTAITNPTKEQQKELGDVIQRIGELTPGAITQVNEYGQILGINATKSREFLEAEKARLAFVNKEALASLDEQATKLQTVIAANQRILQQGKEFIASGGTGGGGGSLVGLRPERILEITNLIKDLSQELKGVQAESQRLRGEPLVNEPAATAGGTGAPEDNAEAEAEAQRKARLEKERQDRIEAAKAAEEARRKEEEQELKALQERAAKLREASAQLQEQQRLDRLSENERRLEEIRLRYQKEIEEAIALEQSKNTEISAAGTEQRIELERLQAEALATEKERIRQEEIAKAQEAAEEAKQLEIEAMQNMQAELQQLSNDLFTAESEEEFLRTQERYNALLELARQFGIDVVAIEQEVARRRSEQQKQVSKDLKQQELDLFLAQKDIQLAKLNLFTTIAEQIGQLAGNNAAIQEAVFAFQKIAAIAEVIIQSQKEKAAIRFRYAVLRAQLQAATVTAPLIPATFAAEAAELTRSNIGMVTSLASIAGTVVGRYVQQKKKGGFAIVRGADDGQLYNARMIGQPKTGLLDYGGPVLTSSGILANEVGKEYYISHRDLDNPKVLNHVRAIENIVTHRQMQNGGFAPTPPQTLAPADTGPSQAETTRLHTMLDANISVLSELMRRGVAVQLDDNTLVAMQKRMNELISTSGGRVL